MKKIILVAAMVLGFAVAASAQPRAIGVRLGNGGEVSYQHSLGTNFLEVDGGLGLGEANYFNISAAGMVGLEYSFWFPLQLSLDFRQHIGIGFGGHGIWYPSSIALGVRYRF